MGTLSSSYRIGLRKFKSTKKKKKKKNASVIKLSFTKNNAYYIILNEYLKLANKATPILKIFGTNSSFHVK